MLPEHCLNHSWIVDNRTKAANDLLSNRPNISIRLSKEVLKSYRRNKHFRVSNYYFRFILHIFIANKGFEKISNETEMPFFLSELRKNLTLRRQ